MISRRILCAALLSLLGVLLNGSRCAAQSSNGTYTLIEEMITAGGELVGNTAAINLQTSLGLPAAGDASNGVVTLHGGEGTTVPAAVTPITTTTTVTGTIDDATATVTVNNMPATITSGTFSAQGVLLVQGPNTITAVATDAAGNTATASIKVYLDLPPAQKTPRFPITVQGTISDPTATVSVNGIPATATSGMFRASVPLVSGLNTLTATAIDAAGKTATASIHVFVPLPTRPPAMPTVGTVGTPPPAVTTQSSLTIGGTKTAGTSIWINGQRVVAPDDQTTWTASVSLVEGDNELVITARDVTGTESAAATLNVIVDNLPPVITFSPPAKTNLTPVSLHGSVDDSRTTVTINGVTAARTQRDFDLAVSLTLGLNSFHLIAVSPNGYTTAQDVTITLRTIPTIQTVQPKDGVKLFQGAVTSIQITAVDQEHDPISYQVLVDGIPLSAWSSSSAQAWTPTVSQIGRHTITATVRDDYGGANTDNVDVFVVRPPIQHP